MKTSLAVLVLLIALGIWTRPLWRRSTPEDSLRQTAGVSVAVLNAQPMQHGWQVQCRVTNERPCPAAQIVLNVKLADANGRVLAANPLAGVSDLVEREAREVSFLVPLHDGATNIRAVAEVSLVRWRH